MLSGEFACTLRSPINSSARQSNQFEVIPSTAGWRTLGVHTAPRCISPGHLPVPSGTNARQSRQNKHVLEIELIPGRFNKADFQGNDFHSQLVLQAQTSKDVT
jgi:hypothetical protein